MKTLHHVAAVALAVVLTATVSAGCATATADPQKVTLDGPTRATVATSQGPLQIIAMGHGSLVLHHPAAQTAVYVDPVSTAAPDGMALPPATHIVITHHHGDHLNPQVVQALTQGTSNVPVVASAIAASKLTNATSLANGQRLTRGSVTIDAVPAYNEKRRRPDGEFFHPKGDGNGYVLTIAGKRIYVSGDTECTPEMKALEGIDVAFVCMNLPYTMIPSEAAVCVDAFKPGVVFPYHHRGQDPAAFKRALKTATPVQVLDWYPTR